jgi:lipoprotein-releasing system permease protein
VYKLLLCWRYLRTRYLALVCIVSVMLGVATLIVVNSVMAGFSTKLKDRLHGLLSDVVVEATDLDGFVDPEGKMARIWEDPFLHEHIAAMTPTMEVFALVQFTLQNGVPIVRMVHLIGIDPEGRKAIGGFSEHLIDERNREHPSFHMRPEAWQRYEETRLRNAQWAKQRPLPPLPLEEQLPDQGWWLFNQDKVICACGLVGAAGSPLEALAAARPGAVAPPAPFKPAPVEVVKAPPPPPPGAILGYAIAHYRNPATKEDVRALHPGDKITLLTIGGIPTDGEIDAVKRHFVVVDYMKTEMSEYDANYVYVPLDYLQSARHMEGRATSIQIKLKDYADAKAVVERLQELFKGAPVEVRTWEQKQGALLAAISIEKGILNVLLFMIIAVAGFGILAIFSMIVVEKTRDIGILKALGASNGGVLKIFLGYGLLLGVVGAGLGTTLGLLFTWNINPIEQGLSRLTGIEVFDRSVYYFKEIPTDVQTTMVVLVNVGAVAIAVLFSVLPALRAALLHPVRALRYE